MFAMALGSVKGLSGLSPRLEEIGIQNVCFYNPQNGSGLDTSMISRVSFIAAVIFGKTSIAQGISMGLGGDV